LLNAKNRGVLNRKTRENGRKTEPTAGNSSKSIRTLSHYTFQTLIAKNRKRYRRKRDSLPSSLYQSSPILLNKLITKGALPPKNDGEKKQIGDREMSERRRLVAHSGTHENTEQAVQVAAGALQ
jgi:hypothetical protein